MISIKIERYYKFKNKKNFMKIEREEETNNSHAQQLQKRNSNQLDEQVDTKIIVNKIKRKRNKKIIRLQWVPIVMRNLKSDTDPIFIYPFFRMMKNYEDEEYNKNRNFGIQEGGIGIFDQIVYDKLNQFLDISVNTFSVGQFDFSYLINLYKSYQNQQYYELAQALEEYQVWSTTTHQNIQQQVQQLPKSKFQQIDEQINVFEWEAKQWANNTFGNDVFEMVIGGIDTNQQIPVLKKIMLSKNLIYFLGSNLEDTYEVLSQQKKKEFLPNFLRDREFSGLFQLKKMIKQLKETMNGSTEYELEDELETFDGFCIPTKKQVKLFYDLQTNEISQKENLQFISIGIYHFEPYWIEYLIEKRSEKNFNKQAFIHSQNQNIINDFDYICQKEYFIDKFYPSQQQKQ